MNESERIHEIVVLRGLPGAGKTTEAYRWVAEDPDFRVRVNLDDISYQQYRKYRDLSRHQKETIATLEHAQSGAAIKAGLSVIVDDQNLDAQSIKDWFSAAEKAQIPCRVVDIETPVEECIRRDGTRLKMVGQVEIYKVAKKFLTKGQLPPLPTRPKPSEVHGSVYVPDTTLEDAYIFDIDGTLAKMHGRSPFAWHRVGEDHPIPNVIRVAQRLSKHAHIILMSGRDEVCYNITADWLDDEGVDFTSLHMRPKATDHGDDEMKLALFDEHVRHKYNVIGVFDDRLRVCRMWENIGLTLFRVGPIDSVF